MATPKLGRIPSVRERVEDTLFAHRNDLVSLLSKYVNQGKTSSNPTTSSTASPTSSPTITTATPSPKIPSSKSSAPPKEAIVLPPLSPLPSALAPRIWEFVYVNVYELTVEQLTVFEYLKFKDELVDEHYFEDHYMLELDFVPFTAHIPKLTQSSSIGNGVQFLNRHLSSIMFGNKDCLEPLVDFLRAHKCQGQLMLNDRIRSVSRLESMLSKAEEYLSKLSPDTTFANLANV